MEKTNQTKTEAELHNDLVAEYLNDLEGIKAAVIEKEHFEAAEVITKSISIIKSAHIDNTTLAKESEGLKKYWRNMYAGMALQAILTRGADDALGDISTPCFEIADAMIAKTLK